RVGILSEVTCGTSGDMALESDPAGFTGRPEQLETPREIGGQRRLEFELLSGDRVAKPESARVESLPGEALEQSVTQATLRGVRPQLLFPAPAVGRIPDHRVADVAEV